MEYSRCYPQYTSYRMALYGIKFKQLLISRSYLSQFIEIGISVKTHLNEATFTLTSCKYFNIPKQLNWCRTALCLKPNLSFMMLIPNTWFDYDDKLGGNHSILGRVSSEHIQTHKQYVYLQNPVFTTSSMTAKIANRRLNERISFNFRFDYIFRRCSRSSIKDTISCKQIYSTIE